MHGASTETGRRIVRTSLRGAAAIVGAVDAVSSTGALDRTVEQLEVDMIRDALADARRVVVVHGALDAGSARALATLDTRGDAAADGGVMAAAATSDDSTAEAAEPPKKRPRPTAPLCPSPRRSCQPAPAPSAALHTTSAAAA